MDNEKINGFMSGLTTLQEALNRGEDFPLIKLSSDYVGIYDEPDGKKGIGLQKL